jgi:FixJ family two-component response regulator
LDKDSSRRAQIAFGLTKRDVPTQIYENLEELLSWAPNDGLLLLNDNVASNALEAIGQKVAKQGGFLPIAMYSEHPSTASVVQAMLAGAIDYLEWPFPVARLDETMARLGGEAEARIRAARRRSEAEAALANLTQREREVLCAMIDGSGNKQIALALQISPRTVEIHRANLLGKLNAQSSSEAIRIGIYGGLDS